jgi:hypothetical protein
MSKKANTSENKPPMHDLLFYDLPIQQQAANSNDEEPCSLRGDTKKYINNGNTEDAIKTLNRIVAMPGLNSRQYLQAHHLLNELVNYSEEYMKLYGIVVEVAIPADLLAMYKDHKATFYN